jgi:pimeloyl-ACP methyl ester carboxylesterase
MTEIVIRSDSDTMARARDGAPPVVLIHGLARSTGSMLLLSHRLARAGFAVWRVGYPSLRIGIAEASSRIATTLMPLARQFGPLDLVGHSLGGIIAARIADAGVLPVGRVVQIGSPNRGSVSGMRLLALAPVEELLGPAGAELSKPLPKPRHRSNTAAIAGVGQGHLPGALLGVKGTGDGTVSVHSAWAGAAERGAVECGHTFLPLSRSVADMTAAFLKRGRLDPDQDGQTA